MGSLWWWVFRTCVLPGWVAGLILWRASSLASRWLDSGNGAAGQNPADSQRSKRLIDLPFGQGG